ncbi:MAG: hypothetical protein PHY45_06525 [Rhodocyclaceae bacterium]|nr:hypothetical protein [Rhodocyclaceae bacterium]
MLAVALVASFAAVFWVRGDEGDAADTVAAAAQTPANSASEASAPSPTALALARLGRRSPADADADPFQAKTWYVAPPPPPPAPPPKSSAPPLPFLYVGKFEEVAGGKLVIYLARGDESFAVSPGDKFDHDYQFEGIERGQIVIVYLPLSIKQRLSVGAPD